MKVLIVEDEKELLDSIVSFLGVEGYVCEGVSTKNEAITKLSWYEYSCVVVDINLPDGSGLDVIKHIKDKALKSGVIIISARDSIEDRVDGLQIGADDYITKPFNLAELNARLKSLYRRIHFHGSNVLTAGALRIHPDEYQVYANEELVELTKKEFDLLMFFLSNAKRVVTKETIAEHLWGDYIDMADSLDFVYTHIKNLRKKLQKKGIKDYIHNIYGLGYKFQIS